MSAGLWFLSCGYFLHRAVIDTCIMKIIKSFLPSIILLIVFNIPAFAQTNRLSITGTLNDEQHKAIPGAVIRLKKIADSSLTKAITSDNAGLFIFNSLDTGTYALSVTAIGFKLRTISNLKVLTDVNLGVLVLSSETKMLAGVTIKGAAPLVDRQIDKTVVKVGQNINNDGLTALELMQRLPGVQVTTDGQVSMAGKAGASVYIDGKPTYLSATDLAALLTSTPASEIEKIEIMSNPSSKYDAAGTGGIINIVKKRNKKAGLNGSVNANFIGGFYGKYNGGFTFNYKTEHYNLLLNNSYAYYKSFSNRFVASDILNGNNSLVSEQASITNGIDMGRNYRPTLGLDVYLSKKTTLSFNSTAGLNSSNNRLFSGMNILDSTRTKTGRIDFTSSLKDNPFNYTVGAQLTHRLDTAGRNFTIDADHSEYRNFPVQNNRSINGDVSNNFTGETDALLLQHRQLDIYAAKADYIQPLKNKGSFEAGIKSSYVKANNDNSYYDQVNGQNTINLQQSDYSINSENINAAYVNLNKAYQKLTAQAGLRAEQTITKGRQILTGESVNQNYLQLFPTVFLNYKADDQNSFTVRFGRRIERPAYSEMVPFRRPQTATLFFEGNPNLRPDISYHSELNWAFKESFFITFGLDLDRDYLRTFPYLDSNKVTITRRPTNVQRAHSWNLDLAYSKKLASWWSTDNTLSIYQNGFSGQAAGFSLNNNGIASVYLTTNNSFSINDKLSAEADLEYNSKRQFVNSTFGAYSVLSIGLRQQVLNKKGSVSVNANNILNSEGHNAIDRNSGLYQYSYFNFYTRTVTLSFSYRFGSGKTTKVKIESGSADEQKRAGN